MVISYKHKYIFVGIPFSASSAITNELINNYSGEFILKKHSNIPTLIKKHKINIKNFIVFGVYRSPEEILKSRYNKLLHNVGNRFSDKKFLIKNGGAVAVKAQNLSKLIREKKLTFKDYLNINFRGIPYDNEFTMNAPFMNYIIDFRNLETDFNKILSSIGIKSKFNLNKVNKTKKDHNLSYELSKSFKKKYFAPFIVYNFKYIPEISKPDVNFFYYLIFLFLRKIREYKFLNSKKSGTYEKSISINKKKYD
tara:strand:+ start:43993 stop:44748 length:756 start_codon:yes stop_codon:yes gene_type:complete